MNRRYKSKALCSFWAIIRSLVYMCQIYLQKASDLLSSCYTAVYYTYLLIDKVGQNWKSTPGQSLWNEQL